jgi:hypothetical protein
MGEETSQSADRIAAGLAYVCKEFASLRAVLPDDEQGPLRRLLAAVRNGEDLAGPLAALHAALLAAGDHLGIWGQRSVTMAGINTQGPFEFVYLCPLGRCSGRSVDKNTVFPLICAITGQELRRERLWS